MPAIIPFKNQIEKIQNELTCLHHHVDTHFNLEDEFVSLEQFSQFSADIVSATKNIVQAISKNFTAADNQLSDEDKAALWSLLFKSSQVIDKSIVTIERTIEKKKFSFLKFITVFNELEMQLKEIYGLSQSAEFKMAHLYCHETPPIAISSPVLQHANTKNHKTKPGLLSKLITRLCVKTVTTVKQEEAASVATLTKTLFSAPNHIRNYQLLVDKKTTVQAIEYLNPNPATQWLIAVGGAGAAYTDMLPIAKDIATRNHYNFLVVDYLAPKINSFTDSVEIILAAATFLLEHKGAKLEDIRLVGHSHGGRLVSEAAAYLPGCSVVTNNTYTSLEEVIISNVLHTSDLLKSRGVLLGHYSEKVINSVTDFIEKHQLDKKMLHVIRNALEATNNGYQSVKAKSKVPEHHYAAVYTASTTPYSSEGKKLSKHGGDKVLFHAVDAAKQSKKSKQQSLEQHNLLSQNNRFFYKDESLILGVKHKDKPNPARHGHHLVLKGITRTQIENTHNVIDADLLGMAFDELDNQKNYRPLTLREHLERLLEKYDLSSQTEHLLPPAGIELNPSECFLLKKIIQQLKHDSCQDEMPTQIQLMRLFQASDIAAEMISAYKPAMDKMVWGDNISEYKKGTKFIKECLHNLSERTTAPNPRLEGVGSYLNKNLAETILKRVHAYHSKLPSQGHGLFSGRVPLEPKLSAMKYHQELPGKGITVSELNLTRAIASGS